MEILNYSLWFTVSWWISCIWFTMSIVRDFRSGSEQEPDYTLIIIAMVIVPFVATLLEYLIVR